MMMKHKYKVLVLVLLVVVGVLVGCGQAGKAGKTGKTLQSTHTTFTMSGLPIQSLTHPGDYTITPVEDTPTTTIAKYQYPYPAVEQWHEVAVMSGWSEAEWPWVACVIFHESRGEAGHIAGLMQIKWSSHIDRITEMGGVRESLRDASFNLQVASAMYHEGQKGRPWHNSTAKCEREGVVAP